MATLHAIDYDSNIERLKNFLKSDVKFKDINFEASGIKTLINMLAYNAHYLGVYAYMLNNESSIDSAQLEQSVFSHARGLGYTPKGVRSSRAEVVITQDLQTFPERGYVVLNRFKTITGTSHRDADSRFFSNPDDVYLYQWVQNPDTTYTFTSKPTVLIEGTYRTWKFQVDASVQYQSFIIKDKTIDIDSLRVFVKKSANDDGIVYQLAKNVFETNATSRVFYVTTTHEGYYEIYFGNGVFGKQPENDNLIICEYISTNGETGNGCTKFALDGFKIIANETSNGGADRESLDTTKFNALNHFRQQNRVFHEADYISKILERYRTVQAINVWGGEDNFQKQYGKVFLSIKPYFADKLSASAKDDIRKNVLEKQTKLGADVVFVDPEFINCLVDVVLKTNIDKTSSSISAIENIAVDAVNQYNKDYLNVFGTTLSDVELNGRVVAASNAITSSFTRKQLQKSLLFNRESTGTQTVYFGNDILQGSVTANAYVDNFVFKIYDLDGAIYSIVNNQHLKIGTVDYEKGLLSLKYPVRGFKGNDNILFTVTPKNPDIDSTLNNIVRITRVRVVNE